MKGDIGNSAGQGGHPCRAAGALQLRFGFPGEVGNSAGRMYHRFCSEGREFNPLNGHIWQLLGGK
jgi:hypothetical protein